MPWIFWTLLLLTMLCAGGLAMAWRRQVKRSRKLHHSLRHATETLNELHAVHTERANRQESHQQKLRGYLRLMDTLINTIPNPIYFKDADGVFQGCNQVFAKQIMGLTRDRIIGKRPQELPGQIPADQAAACLREELKLAERDGAHAFEARIRCADGRQRDYLFSLAALAETEGQIGGSVAVLSDLTAKNRAEQDRLQKEKLEGVLETAGAVCHEFNQPLQSLSGYAEIMEIKLEGREAQSYIAKITAQIDRLRDITDKLQGVTRYETTQYAGSTRIIDIHRSS